MDLLEALIQFGGALLCAAIPVFGLGVLLVWLAPRLSSFFKDANSTLKS
jgi:hypothetical protein